MVTNIPAGARIPDDFNAVIEIPAECGSVKYELDKATSLLKVDRFMQTAMHYPCNYGFVPSTLAEDGDPVDVLVITPYAVHPGCLIRVRALGVLKMTDEAGNDSKILALPVEKICPQMADIKSLKDLPPILLDSISHFFEHYKDLEADKWVKIDGWENRDAAEKEINASIQRYQQHATN